MANDATRAQVSAADPAKSVWLAANAGSGKTRVLTDRVARLLLAGTEPQKILCLTYTKAAASEMQNRLFARLGKWAMQDEASLRAELAELGIDGAIGTDVLIRARRLFAQAIETPGGLKIQTIHSFCASLLRRFPLEAGISPDFIEMDDRAARLLRQEIVEALAAGADRAAMDALAWLAPTDDLKDVLAEICANAEAFPEGLDRAAILALLGLPAGFDHAALIGDVLLGGEAELFAELVPILQRGKSTDVKLAGRLAQLPLADPGDATLADLEDLFLFKEKSAAPFAAKIGDLPTKDMREGPAAPLMPRLEALMRRVEAARGRRLALAAADKTAALHRFAGAFLPRYRQRKAGAGLLDFDDLIRRAAALLSDRSVAAWVLFRLDGGIDHILVDEAQDTSPGQWRVIGALADEFTAGEGARNRPRRIFVVGDAKQSIYSFQGADLGAFRQMAETFRSRHEASGAPFQTLDLLHSFRSSEAILRTVDLTFGPATHGAIGGPSRHRAFRADLPGRVDLWPPVPVAEKPEPKAWDDPVDILPPAHHTVILAEQIAERIAAMIGSGVRIPAKDGGSRPVHAGDFLILVQRRSALFREIIRACKAKGLTIAGADRMVLGGELAVKDLTALLSFLATPEDDLSLAAALRSPLFGWTEGQLYDLAQGRGDRVYLWQALRGRAAEHPETLAILDDMRAAADFLRPYELVERMLTRHDGRRRLLGRLGAEAEDGLDAFLAAALGYEQMGVPSLTGFLVWLASDETEIKRRLDSSAKAIRVMTVHGAKGLEAPIVILPDTAVPKRRERGSMVCPDGLPALWRQKAADNPPAIEAEAARRRARAEEEDKRLLYVAMTRAEVWLIVAAAGDVGKEGQSWYQLIAEGARQAGMVDGRLAFGTWPDNGVADEGGGLAGPDAPPDWTARPAPRPVVTAAALSPSGLGGAKAMAGDAAGEGARGRAAGTALHLLLEHLPQASREDWPALAARLVRSVPDLAEADAASVTTDALSLLARPELAWVFAPDTLAEVELSAALPDLGGALMQGAIDRLAVGADRVTAVDFKSNAVVPGTPAEVPDGILRQMGAYAAMLGAIYPGRAVEVAILWTRTGDLMPLPLNMVRDALLSYTVP